MYIQGVLPPGYTGRHMGLSHPSWEAYGPLSPVLGGINGPLLLISGQKTLEWSTIIGKLTEMAGFNILGYSWVINPERSWAAFSALSELFNQKPDPGAGYPFSSLQC